MARRLREVSSFFRYSIDHYFQVEIARCLSQTPAIEIYQRQLARTVVSGRTIHRDSVDVGCQWLPLSDIDIGSAKSCDPEKYK
jgi:hypothetical protein